MLAFWLGLPAMAVLIPTVGKRKLGWKKRVALIALMLMLLVMLLAMSGCGGGNSTPAPGTSLGPHGVNIVATSGSLSHTTPVTVTVQ